MFNDPIAGKLIGFILKRHDDWVPLRLDLFGKVPILKKLKLILGTRYVTNP